MRFVLHLLFLWLAAASVSAPARARPALDRTERALAAAVDAQRESAIGLLQRAVDINSGTLNPDGVRRVGDLFRAEFESLGFSTHWVDGAPFHRAGHLVAERGTRGPKVLLIGHLDTVFEPDSPFQKFERVDADDARGPGITDMKGGIVVALTALRALQSAHVLDRLRVTFVMNGDEELIGDPVELARAALVQAAQGADAAIGLENGADDPATAVGARRGASSWTLSVDADSAHSSQIFRDDVGSGAIFEMARILNAFHAELGGERYLTFNPGLVLGGAQVELDASKLSGHAAGKGNIIAPRAVASGDLRALTVEQRERAEARMREIVAGHPAHASAQIVFDDDYPPMAPSDGNAKLLAMFDLASRDLGFGPVTAVDPARAGAADISFIADRVPMCMDGIGLQGGGSHTPDEHADLRTFRIQAQRLAVLLYRLSRH